MRSGRWLPIVAVLWLFGAVLVAALAAPAAGPIAVPWHIENLATDVTRHDVARPGPAAAAEAGPQKYLHIVVHFNTALDAQKKYKFHVVNQRGDEVGELWGWNDSRSLVVFEGQWISLAGLYLDGSGHREPLFATMQVATRLNPVVVAPRLPPGTIYMPGTGRLVLTGTERVIARDPQYVVIQRGTSTIVVPNTVVVTGTAIAMVPTTVVSGPSVVVSGPSTSIAGPSTSISGASNSVSGPSNSVTGDTNSVSGDSNSKSGDTNSKSGDTNSTSGDTNSKSGDTNSKSGDSNSTSGDTNSKSGDSNSTSGDTNSKSGDTNSTSGDTNSKSGDSNSTSGDSNSKSGDSNSKSGDSNSTSGPSNSTSGPGGSSPSGPTPPGPGGQSPTSPTGPMASLTPRDLPRADQGIALYVSTGAETTPGKIYQLDETGHSLGRINLRYTATGMALHRTQGLLLAVPRDGGKLMRIDESGRLSTVLEKDPALPHPVAVAVAAGSDSVVVGDNFANALVVTSVTGAKPRVYQRLDEKSYTSQDMSLAVTKDKYVIFSSAGSPGVFRYGGGQSSAGNRPVLRGGGGVAADTATFRYAAAQEPNHIYIYEGGQMLKKFRLPPGKTFYRNGLLSFAPGGSICVAVRDGDDETGDVWLLKYDIEKDEFKNLFPCRKEQLQAFVAGPRMSWSQSR